MANEITFGFIHSQTLYATVYEPNGDTRTARALMTEKETDTGYYIKDDGSIQTGDFVIIDNGTRNVGQGQYRPDAQVINPEDCKATGFSTHDAASVWAVGTRTLSAGTRDTEIDAILALIEASGAGIDKISFSKRYCKESMNSWSLIFSSPHHSAVILIHEGTLDS